MGLGGCPRCVQVPGSATRGQSPSPSPSLPFGSPFPWSLGPVTPSFLPPNPGLLGTMPQPREVGSEGSPREQGHLRHPSDVTQGPHSSAAHQWPGPL